MPLASLLPGVIKNGRHCILPRSEATKDSGSLRGWPRRFAPENDAPPRSHLLGIAKVEGNPVKSKGRSPVATVAIQTAAGIATPLRSSQ